MLAQQVVMDVGAVSKMKQNYPKFLSIVSTVLLGPVFMTIGYFVVVKILEIDISTPVETLSQSEFWLFILLIGLIFVISFVVTFFSVFRIYDLYKNSSKDES
jgi:uncharacterized protein YneF (UPF0154 family)